LLNHLTTPTANESEPRQQSGWPLAKPVLSKKMGLYGLLGLTVLSACTALLGFSSSKSMVDQNAELAFLSSASSYLQGGSAALVGQNSALRVADQVDAARSESIRLSKDESQMALFLSKKYRLASSEVEKYVYFAQLAGKEKNIDPLLILAVMSIESNLNSITESPVKAQGLMQVLTAVHIDKLAIYGGPSKVFDPQVNIMVGATILADCIKLGGSVEMGLKCYVGASGPSDGGYGAKVLAEKERIDKARLGVFDFTANNKVLQDMGLIAAPNTTNAASSVEAGLDLNAAYAQQNTAPIATQSAMPTPLAAPAPSPAPSTALHSGVLPPPQTVTLPASAPLMSANALQNPAHLANPAPQTNAAAQATPGKPK
jgi:hypothetical protein